MTQSNGWSGACGATASPLRRRTGRMVIPAAFHLHRFTGSAVHPYLDDLARLRMAVFGDWPYLYDGDLDYERDYLAAYAASPRSVFVLAMDSGRVVGAATGIPLAEDAPAFQHPFRERGIDVARVFYFGESVLLHAWRGRGIGHGFFDHRQAHARELGGFALTAFAAVDRAADDPRCPPGHRGNEPFWERRGYVRQPGMTMRLAWNERERGQIDHALTFWTRPL